MNAGATSNVASPSTLAGAHVRPVLSIVTTLYNSASTIEAFYQRAVAAASAITDAFEIVIVDDGSPDDSLAVTLAFAARDPRVKVIELSRNFGHHKALMTGMMHATGDYCFLIDSDLEEDPALLGEFWRKLHDTGMDVIYGYQARRMGDGFRRISGLLAYRVIELLIPYKIPRNHVTVRLMRRAYVDSLLLHKERQVVIGGLWVITGYRQLGVAVNKLVRAETTYSFRRRWSLLLDAVTSFSEVPLVAIFYLGIAISALSMAVSITIVVLRLFIGVAIEGWVSVMLSVWFLGGLAIFCIGVVGVYVSKIFIETKERPYTIVRMIHHFDAPIRESRTDAESGQDVDAKAPGRDNTMITG
jgi:putative glycosyltransferase